MRLRVLLTAATALVSLTLATPAVASPSPVAAAPVAASSVASADHRLAQRQSATRLKRFVLARQVVRRTNRIRARHGLRPVVMRPCPRGFAVRWSRNMARTGQFRHQSLSPILRRCNAMAVGENIAAGYPTSGAVMRGWMNSPGHRANILNPQWRRIGVGVVRDANGTWYWTQDFAR